MADIINLKIITPEKVILDEEVGSVIVRTVDSARGILPRRAPLVAMLELGVLIYRQGGVRNYMVVAEGIMEVKRNKVIILTEAAEEGDDIRKFGKKMASLKQKQKEAAHKAELQFTEMHANLMRAMRSLTIRQHQEIEKRLGG